MATGGMGKIAKTTGGVLKLIAILALVCLLLVGGFVGWFAWAIQDETPSAAECKVERVLSDPGFPQLVSEMKNPPEGDLG